MSPFVIQGNSISSSADRIRNIPIVVLIPYIDESENITDEYVDGQILIMREEYFVSPSLASKIWKLILLRFISDHT